MDRSVVLYPEHLDPEPVMDWLKDTPVRLQPPFATEERTRLTFDFGRRFHLCPGPLRLHTGLDIGRCRGATLLAPTKMIIRRSYHDPAGGGAIFGEIFDSSAPGPVYLRFFHVARRSVREGQIVEMGEPLGRMTANSGSNSTGLHLHLELLFGRRWPDPWKYAVNPRELADTKAWLAAIGDY